MAAMFSHILFWLSYQLICNTPGQARNNVAITCSPHTALLQRVQPTARGQFIVHQSSSVSRTRDGEEDRCKEGCQPCPDRRWHVRCRCSHSRAVCVGATPKSAGGALQNLVRYAYSIFSRFHPGYAILALSPTCNKIFDAFIKRLLWKFEVAKVCLALAFHCPCNNFKHTNAEGRQFESQGFGYNLQRSFGSRVCSWNCLVYWGNSVDKQTTYPCMGRCNTSN